MINCRLPPLQQQLGALSIILDLNQLLKELHRMTNFHSMKITLDNFEISVQSLNTPLRFGEIGPQQPGMQGMSGSSEKPTSGFQQSR